jgi:TolB protein
MEQMPEGPLGAIDQVWTMDSDGSGLRRLTAFRHGAANPSWSPDGDRIALSSPGSVYVVGATGSIADERSAFESPWQPHGAGEPAWSPDGTTLIVVGRVAGPRTLFVFALDGPHEATVVTTEIGKASSPDWCG